MGDLYLFIYIKKVFWRNEESGIITKKSLVGNKFNLIIEKNKDKLLITKPKDAKDILESHEMSHYFCSATE